MLIAQCTAADAESWLALRLALWPHATRDRHLTELSLLGGRSDAAAFIARRDGVAIGFAEATLRHDYVNGCTTSPVGFLEGIYVAPASRQLGIARRLAEAIASWAVGLGCSELASDATLDNTISHAMHVALGFAATERVVFYRKPL